MSEYYKKTPYIEPLTNFRKFPKENDSSIDFRSLFDLIKDKKTLINPVPAERESALVPKEGFEMVAGQDAAVAEARKFVTGIKDPDLYARRGARPTKGLLLYGPPGTGKTLLARAIAGESGATFISINQEDVSTAGLQGISEERVKQIFAKIAQMTARGEKVVLFFDELDAIAPDRNAPSTSSSKSSVVTMLLKAFDGMNSDSNVFLVATTNRVDAIDPAIRRSGRFDKQILVDLPTAEGREAIIKVHIARILKKSTAPDEMFAENFEIDVIALHTAGYSGADLEFLLMSTIEAKIDAELNGTPWTPITTVEVGAHIRRVIAEVEQKRSIGF